MNKHLSITQIKMFLRCPLQYFFRYKQGIKLPPNSSMTMGRCVHKAIEDLYKKKIEKKEMTEEETKERFSSHWAEESKETEFKRDETSGELKDEGIKLISKYLEDIAPTVKPKELEKRFELEFENVPYTLVGIIDLIEVDGTIVDHKCSKRSPNQGEIDRDIQLSAYQIAYRSLYGQDPKGLRYDYVVRNKTPKTVQCQTMRSQASLERFLKLVGHVSKAIEQDIDYPNESMMCSCCGYKAICKKW
jgi:RecB family exonuclease